MSTKFRKCFKMETANRILSKFGSNFTRREGPTASIPKGWPSCWKNFSISRNVNFATNVSYRGGGLNAKLFTWGQQITRNLRRSAKTSPKNSIGQQITGSGPNPSRFTMSDRYNLILKPFAFVAFVGSSSVVGCTIWQYEEYRQTLAQDRRFSIGDFKIPIPGRGTTTQSPERNSNEIRRIFDSWWVGLSAGEKIFWPICAINCMVWLAWRVPALAPVMVTYFSATPVSRAVCWPMLLSTFSHYSFYHLAANMFVLHSFIPAGAAIMGKENFVAMYLTSGVVASLGSHLNKLYLGSNVPSVGASGAIMGILGLVCTRMPDIQLGIIFLPGIQFSADTALKCILAVDTAGLLAGWRFMDHAAHLSGCLFGIAFSYWGAKPLGSFRDFVLSSWHKFRTTSAS